MANLLGIGTKVKFLTTPDSGIIIAKLGDGMVMVQLDDVDMEIPAFEEDLLRADAFFDTNPTIATPQYPKPFLGKKTAEPQQNVLKKTFKIENTGVQLAFFPIKKTGGEVEKMDIALVNDTLFDAVFTIDFVLFGDVKWSKDGLLKSGHLEIVGELAFDLVNDAPEINVVVKPVFTEGVGESLSKMLKIKSKQFVKNLQFSKTLDREAHIFSVFEKLNTPPPPTDDLKKYTTEVVKTQKRKWTADDARHFIDPTPDVSEYAAFVPEIDLHIEMIHDNPRSLTTEEIVRVQIRHFEQFVEKAVRLAVPKIYIIHGIGKGKLRDMIAARLRRHSDVLMFKNEYNERFGFGATEVWLK